MIRLKGLSLFSNVGMAETFFKEEGVDILIANELIEERAKFYEHLYPETHMICGDITDDSIRNKIVDESLTKGVDFIIATPPCQGMSVAGNRDPYDKRNQLIYYAVDVIKRVNPCFVMIENVPTLLKTKINYNGELTLIDKYLKEELSNYAFNEESLISAKDHGVPQIRQRNIYLLVRKDINIVWKFPAKQKPITVRDAIGHLPSIDPLLREGYEETIKRFPDFERKKKAALAISKWNYPPTHSWKHVNWMLHTPTGKSAIFNEVYYPQKDNGDHIVAHHNHYRRLSWDKPCRTITMNNGVISSLCCVHPGREYKKDGETLYSDPRVLTLYELFIVSSLPVDWNVPSWAKESLIRHVIGEGIPPKLSQCLIHELMIQLNK